jgi:hypothetical protein
MAERKTVRIVQVVILVAIVAAAMRLVVVMRGRHEKPVVMGRQQTAAPPLNREAYVVPKKLYIGSLKSAEQLTKHPVWVKEGYRYTVYPFAHGVADFKHPAGMLLPIQKIQIKQIATGAAPGSPKQVLAVFDQDGKAYAVPIGSESGEDVQIYADEMFFYEDPHDLYNFWPADVWDAINKHEAQKGMNEYQMAFAVGMGTPEPGGDSSQKTVHYPNGGKALVVRYQNGKAVEVKQVQS